MTIPQIVILSGSQFVQRGKKFAITDQRRLNRRQSSRQSLNAQAKVKGRSGFRKCEEVEVESPGGARVGQFYKWSFAWQKNFAKSEIFFRATDGPRRRGRFATSLRVDR